MQHVPVTLLSAREVRMLTLVAQGFTNGEAAEAMGIGVKTAETYRLRLSKKLGLKTRAALFRYAFDAGLITAEQLVKDVPGYVKEETISPPNDRVTPATES